MPRHDERSPRLGRASDTDLPDGTQPHQRAAGWLPDPWWRSRDFPDAIEPCGGHPPRRTQDTDPRGPNDGQRDHSETRRGPPIERFFHGDIGT